MADSEWWCVEKPDGAKVSGLDRVTDYTNREEAARAAQNLAGGFEDPLTIVKYTRREIRTFTKKVTIEEADVSQRT